MRYRIVCCGAIVVSVCGLSALVGGDERPTPSAAAAHDPLQVELAAIRAASQSFVDAFNKGDAPAVAAHWTSDGDYTDETGQTIVGREAIAEAYGRFLAEHPGARMQVVIDALRLIGDGVAIEDGRTLVELQPGGPASIGRYTAVHAKVDGQWLMSAVRDGRIESDSAHPQMADLEWLIGGWTAEEHGIQWKSNCQWVANKHFIERRYHVTQVDGSSLSGVQLIGVHPQTGQVQSWNFSSDGGHAVGVWSPRQGGWMAQMRGVTGDGTNTTAVNLLTRLDNNAYAWQSVERTANGAAMPDTDEVVLKRDVTSR